MPDDTVIDGEVVALDETVNPSFNLQNFESSKTSLVYYVFDLLTFGGRDVMSEPLSIRRELLAREILSNLRDPIRESPILDASLPDLIEAVKAQGLEGVVAKLRDSGYEELNSDLPRLAFLQTRVLGQVLESTRASLAASAEVPSPQSQTARANHSQTAS